MGLFSSEKEITVESVVYNLAGDELKRPSYLKSLVIRNVISETKDSISETLQKGYIHGPAIKYRAFYRWAKIKKNFGQIGMPKADLEGNGALNPELVAPEVPYNPLTGETVWVQQADLGVAKFSYWAEQWILENSPELFDTNWTVDFNGTTKTVKITFEDLTTTSFVVADFNYKKKYIYAYYNLVTAGVAGPIVPGSLVALGTDEFPDISDGWVAVPEESSETPITVPLDTVVTKVTTVSYSDGTPDDETTEGPTTTSGSTLFDSSVACWTKSTYLGGEEDLVTQIEKMYFFQDYLVTSDTTVETDTSSEVVDGVTITTTVVTTTETESVTADRSYRLDTQTITDQSMSPLKLYIYKLGSGNPDLDGLVNKTLEMGDFYPAIPVRILGQFVSETFLPGAYKQAKKAYKKLTSADFDDLIEKVNENKDIADIDYVYAVMGVSLNVRERSCKRYLYSFFEKLQSAQIGGANLYAIWKAQHAAKTDEFAAWQTWKAAQADPENPLYGTSEPAKPSFATMPSNTINLTNEGAFQYNVNINWNFVTNGKGKGRICKVGDCEIIKQATDSLVTSIHGGTGAEPITYETIRIYWQRTATTYTYLDVVGLTHYNWIYEGHAVITSAYKALDDDDESGFIIPLHNETFRKTSLVHSSQMSTASLFLVFNCYTIKKKKWYENDFFRILLVIAIAIVSTLFTGGAGFGLLGAHMAVGGFFGLTGMAAAIVGSVVNAMASLILVTLIEKVAVGALGPVVGGILATVLGIVAGGISSGFSSGTFTMDWSALLNADNLIALTSSVGNAYANMINQDTAKIGQQMADYDKESKSESEKIQQAFLQEFGYGNANIDPLMFTKNSPSMTESSDTFLTRTLMTGSDIVELSQDLLYNFPEYSTKLPNAFT